MTIINVKTKNSTLFTSILSSPNKFFLHKTHPTKFFRLVVQNKSEVG